MGSHPSRGSLQPASHRDRTSPHSPHSPHSPSGPPQQRLLAPQGGSPSARNAPLSGNGCGKGNGTTPSASARDAAPSLASPAAAQRPLRRFEPELVSNSLTTIIMCDVVDPSDIIHHTEFRPEGGMALVRTLREIFSEFAMLAERHNVRKIRAINDSWLGVAGLDGHPSHAENAMRMAQEMIMVAREMDVPIRIGIHTGALMSGVISRSAPFDVWGVSLKEAGLMLALCPPMRVNVSPSTYPMVQDSFPFETREISIDQERGKTFFVLADELLDKSVASGLGDGASTGAGGEDSAPNTGRVEKSHVPRILLVDDNATTRKAVQRMLQAMNCEAYEAKNGKEALSFLDRCWPMDIVFMDIEMPVMNGWDTTEHIRFRLEEPVRSVPIVALTSHATADVAQRCLEEGMDDFMTKPIRPHLLLKIVEKWVKNFYPDSTLPVPLRPGQGHLGIVEGVATSEDQPPGAGSSGQHSKQQQKHHRRQASSSSHRNHRRSGSDRQREGQEELSAPTPAVDLATSSSGGGGMVDGTLIFESSGEGTGTGTGVGAGAGEEDGDGYEVQEPVRKRESSSSGSTPILLEEEEDAAGKGKRGSRRGAGRRRKMQPKVYPYCWGESSVTGAGAEASSASSSSTPTPVDPPRRERGGRQQKERRVLVCDDSNLTRKMVVRMLQRFHCQVVGVRNGEEGMRAIQEQGPFQMVFMDIHMPVMDGFATTRAIRQLDPPMGDVAIVAITAYTTRDDSERYVQAGMDDFVCKPLKVAIIKELLDKFLDSPA